MASNNLPLPSGVADHKGISRGKCHSCACLSYKEVQGSNKCSACACPSSVHEAQSGCVGSPGCKCREYVHLEKTNDCYQCGHLPKDHRGLGRKSVAVGTENKKAHYGTDIGSRDIYFSDMLRINTEKRKRSYAPSPAAANRGKVKKPKDGSCPLFRKTIKIQLKRPRYMRSGKKKTYVEVGDQKQILFNKETTMDNVMRACASEFLDIKAEDFVAQSSQLDFFLLDGKARVTDPTYSFNKQAFNFCYVKASEHSYASVSSEVVRSFTIASKDSIPPLARESSKHSVRVISCRNSSKTCTSKESCSLPGAATCNELAHVPLNTKQLLEVGKSFFSPCTATPDRVYRATTFDVATQSWQPLGIISLVEEAKPAFAEGGMREAFKTTLSSSNSNPLLATFKVGCNLILKQYLHSLVKAAKEKGRDIKKLAMKEVQTQMVVAHLAKQFKLETSGRLQQTPEVIPCFLLESINNQGDGPLFMEVALEGKFQKYLNNNGEATRTGLSTKSGEICLAFAHWAFLHSKKQLLVTDLQGVDLQLTDVEVSTKDSGYFGIGNLGAGTLTNFKSKHVCNDTCKLLGLQSLAEDEDVPKSQFTL